MSVYAKVGEGYDGIPLDSKYIFYEKSHPSHNDQACIQPNPMMHRLVSTENNKLKKCAYCRFYKVKTKSGWRVATRHMCEACRVPLCKEKRDCFLNYHSMYFSAQK